ncbi:ferredoxin oxidoreductase [Candidatus Shapirobacteria bacterium CG10_big_fil_rev_8_21_14_0_10_40_9]|uniref:Ferredoxin oxidoreductase n=1 Tax=Candidatus Shapirobacteria bacterium CG10_big_fil_rev_8_21_14_0_10_40_9 TaxID=1974888 RepID=A0A2M8L3X9_9BACT|nr:MAG: ferredoxin oxidoreductase [Candidatus Shapirobacteria bacterium CG10_big_fil_rev_8_21_14_0_10_40_9]
MRQFLMGNEVLAKAAFEAGAKIMFGYPITPTTEVLATWVRLVEKSDRKYLQTEDEMAAGFGVCGSVLAGVPAFTATAGPGTILMQDPLSMAEAMRLPMVVFIGQRGGPSTGQVIYSQQELNLAIFGGNGEGLRLVYAPSSLQELYDLTLKAFTNAWKYRFPTFVLYDGYLGKMKGPVEISEQQTVNSNQLFRPILTNNMRNCYNLEEEVYELNMKNFSDWQKMADEICEYEITGKPSETIIIAYGSVAQAAKDAGVFLFRPITVWPFPEKHLKEKIKSVKKLLILESSLGQLGRLVKNLLYGLNLEIEIFAKPALGFTPEEILKIYGT